MAARSPEQRATSPGMILRCRKHSGRSRQDLRLTAACLRDGERDGVNDAPALAQADVGIAMATGTDVAIETAGITLLGGDVSKLVKAIKLSKMTMLGIKQNLFWAFFYNAAGVPLAALGFLSPVLCATAMGLSDLVVIGNALRLRRWKL